MSETAPRQRKRVEELLGTRWTGQASQAGMNRGASAQSQLTQSESSGCLYFLELPTHPSVVVAVRDGSNGRQGEQGGCRGSHGMGGGAPSACMGPRPLADGTEQARKDRDKHAYTDTGLLDVQA